ncbi:PASTA domain-containing protein [Streptomyces sp. NPDC054796]
MDTTLQDPSPGQGRGDPLVGQVLDGRYRIDSRIAVGGMATVYRALDTRLDRELALKVMHPSLAVDSTFVDRFIREAKSVARLAHPNVVGVFDQGTDSSYVYLAMEYVSGCTLRDVLRDRGALQPRAALDVMEPMLAALGAAHRAGLVHRDMKPENVLIGDDGRVKVADFGLVRTVDSQTSATTDSILGTVSYLAPEQIEEGQADTRTDLYACGVMLYEMLTGAKPHSGSTPAQVLYLHLHEGIPAPSAVVPGLAPGMDALVARACARDPRDRPDDAVALLSETRTARAGLTDAELDAMPPMAVGAASAPVQRGDGTPDAPHHGTPAPEPDPEDAPARALAHGEGGPDDAGHASGHPAGDGHATGYGDSAGYGSGPAGADGAGSEDRTSVLPRVAPTPSPTVTMDRPAAPADGGVLDRTTRLASPALAEPQTAPEGPGGPDSPGGHRRRRGSGSQRWVVVTLAVVLLALIGTGVWYVTTGQFTQTPAVLDKTETEATKTLESAGLDVKVTRDYSERIERGHVIDSDPAPGSRIRNTGTVTLTISRGPQIVKVPDLSGTPLSDAKRELREAGLKAGDVKRAFDEETAQGSVISTDPGAGTKKRPGAAVALTVSKGAPLEVPDVVGEDEGSAQQELREAGFKVRVAEKRVFSEEDEGTVARQSPADGATGAKGDTVTLTVSKGQDMVEVPDVEDLAQDEAREKLEAAGFTVDVRRLFIGDTVFNQSPGGGEEAPRGSEVTLWIR